MKLDRLFQSLLLTSAVVVCVSAPAQSGEVTEDVQGESSTQTISKSTLDEKVAVTDPTSAQMLVQSPTPTNPPNPEQTTEEQIIPIAAVKATSGEKGVEIILETPLGEQLQVTNRSADNTFIADIPNAQLRLPNGNTFNFRSEKPAAGIIEITVINADANTVRVTVVGENALPTVELFDDNAGLVFGINSTATAMQPPAPQQPTPQPSETPQAEQQPTDQTPQQQPPAPSDDAIELVVTGEEDGYRASNATTGSRLDIPLIETPASIGVITEEFIEDKAPRRVEDLAPYISGVTAGDSGQGGLFTDFQIRGFSTGSQVYVNGLRDNFRSLVRDFANIERLEILKGFSSLLYGTGSPGGVVNYITKKPQATPAYKFSADIGNFNFYRSEVDLTGPLTDDKNVLYRLILAFQDSDSFVDNVEDNRIFVAPSLTFSTGEGGTLTIEGEYYRQDKDTNSGAKFLNGEFFYDRSYTDPRNSQIYDHYRIAAYLDQPISKDWSLNLSGQYFNTQRDLNPLFTSGFFEGDNLNRFYRTLFDDYYQYNLRGEVKGNFNIGASEHKLLVGAEYNKYRSQFTGNLAFFGNIDLANPTFDVPIPTQLTPSSANFSDSNWGVYIQDFVKLGQFRLLAGLRYGGFEFINGGVAQQEDNFISPSIGLVYRLTDSASIYASFSQSTEPQFGLLSDGGLADPRKATQYEVGAKVNLLDDRLSVTAALFQLEQTNIAQTDPTNPDFNILVGDIRSRGFELDVKGKVTENLSLIAAYTYLDSEITTSVVPGQQGNRPINTPEHSLGLYGKYEFTEGSLRGLSLGTGLVYVGEREGDNENSFQLPSYVRVDLGAAYKINNLTFRLAVENLLDIRYASGSNNAANITQGSPFAITGSVSVQF
ncbi:MULTISPECIES: TonB-dependent siderophore receptor [Nostoc]|uniref:TonB-dependent siderophore receptor n=1 Tax=Nostoc paludosum FACHB-159 TaxID=2692908 RepID=A0ABR8K7K3_9NOSO|nr:MULTISPECIES: TonB-dependent siderophore receptor [Nostoc]MBD2677465.1 TonB-dependent siderophore receptor [Nostoc sp. FACHB-857]MBD2734142.1 TonB-dependent siderophore receptor [Nostoc paludosum FACHB-159]